MKGKLVLIILLMGSRIFANGTSDAMETGPVSFDFWTSQTQSDRLATIGVLVDTYTALNPEVSINLIPVNENDVAIQLNASNAAGALPGLVELGVENAVAFGSEGLFDQDITSALLDEIGKDKFYEGVLRLVESGDSSYYALPYHGWIQGIWYRKDWFEEANLAPPNTWENVLTAAQYFYQPEKNQYGILVGTKAESFAEQCFTPIAMSNGAGLFDKEGTLIFNSPEMKEAVDYYAQLAQYNPPGPQTWRARDYYIQGRMAMFFYSTYIMDDLAKAEVAASSLTGENFSDLEGQVFDPELTNKTGFAPILSHSESAGYGVVNAMAIPKQENKAISIAASRFLRYLYTQNAYITYLHMAPGGMNPTLKGIADNPRYQADPQELFKRYGTEKMNEIVGGMRDIKTFSIVDGRRMDAASVIFSNQIIPRMLFAITQEGVPVDTAMLRAEEEMKKLVN